MKILVANVGSTSFKYKLFEMDDESVLARGRIERIGDPESPTEHQVGASVARSADPVVDYPDAVRGTLSHLFASGALESETDLGAVGFKTVHLRGAHSCFVLDEDVLSRMEDYSDVAPAHNPPYIAAIRIFRELYPSLTLVGLFEGAFHHTLSPHAYIYGLPYAWYERHGVRKYGFHGASHRYVSEHVSSLLGRNDLRLVSCHLGGSSSLCAIQDGQSVDTTMGFSPQDGILNGTRNGHIDPFIIPFIMEREGLSSSDVVRILSRESGLLGISGISGDLRDLESALEDGNERAGLAVYAFCYGVRKEIGAMAAAMGGADVLAFAGGIGERGADARRRICEDLGYLGFFLDEDRNRVPTTEGMISTDESPGQILVVQTDEEIIVARETAALLSRGDGA